MKFKLSHLIWYSPILIAVVMSFTCVGVTSLDSSAYLKRAIDLINGKMDWLHRPGFTLLLGFTLELFGVSIQSATALIRFFFVANVVALFSLSAYLFNRKIAFIASMGLVSSYSLGLVSRRVLLDNVHPCFMMLSILLMLYAIDKKSNLLSIAAGIVFAYTYLMKSTVVLLLPFPILAALAMGEKGGVIDKFKHAVVVIASSSLGIIFYHILKRSIEGHVSVAKGVNRHMFRFSSLLETDSSALLLKALYNGVVGFWDKFFFQDTFLGILFLLSWGWVLLRGWKNKSCRILLVILVLYLPAMAYLGNVHLRLGQLGIFLFLSYIPVGLFIYDVSKGLESLLIKAIRGRVPKIVGSGLRYTSLVFIGIATVSFSTYQVLWASKSSKNFFQETYVGHLIAAQKPSWRLEGVYSDVAKTRADIISGNFPSGSKVLAGVTNACALKYFANEYDVSQFKTSYIKKADVLKEDFGDNLQIGRKAHGKVLFLWPNGWVRQIDRYSPTGDLRLRFIDEEMFLEMLGSSESVCLALNNRYKHISTYLAENYREKVMFLSEAPLILKVDPIEETKDLKPRVAHEIGLLLNDLRDRNPAGYRIWREKIFPEVLGFSPDQVDAIADFNAEKADVVFMGINNRPYKRWIKAIKRERKKTDKSRGQKRTSVEPHQ